MTWRHSPNPIRRWLGAVCLAALATACGAAPGAEPAATDEGAASHTEAAEATEEAGSYPVTVEACDSPGATFEAPPERIMTSNGSSLELLFWLGAQDRVIGTGFPPTPGSFPEEFAAEAEGIEVLSERTIANEVLLGSDADMLLKTFSGGMHADEPTAEQLADAGVGEVVLRSTACADRRSEPQADLSLVLEDIRSVAQELTDGMQTDLDAVAETVADVAEEDRPTVFFFDYDAGTEMAFTACNRQVANGVITAAGGRNLFADCAATYQDVGWEQVIERDPDVILIGLRARPSSEELDTAFAEAEDFLRTFAPTSTLRAVTEGRFVRTPTELTTIAGVRNAETVQAIAATLYPDRFAGQPSEG